MKDSDQAIMLKKQFWTIKKFNFLYEDEKNCHFMDQTNYQLPSYYTLQRKIVLQNLINNYYESYFLLNFWSIPRTFSHYCVY